MADEPCYQLLPQVAVRTRKKGARRVRRLPYTHVARLVPPADRRWDAVAG